MGDGAEGQSGTVLKVTAELTGEGYAPNRQALLMGVGGRGEGLVVLLDPDEQAARGLAVAPTALDVEPETEVNLVRAWQVQALQGETPVSTLEQPATLIFSAQGLAEAGMAPAEVDVWTRESAGEAWRVAPAEYRAEEQIFVVRTRHFSEWGLGDGLSAKGVLLPTTRGFSSDRFTGAAGVEIPVEAPGSR